ESLLLVDSGEPVAPGLDDRAFSADRRASRQEIDGIGRHAAAVREALLARRPELVAERIAEEWEMRKGLVPAVTTAAVDRIIAVARAAGGAGRACGAGGGMVALWGDPGPRGAGVRERLEEGLRAAGFRPLKFRVDLRGVEVE